MDSITIHFSIHSMQTSHYCHKYGDKLSILNYEHLRTLSLQGESGYSAWLSCALAHWIMYHKIPVVSTDFMKKF